MINLKDRNKRLLVAVISVGAVLVGVSGWFSWSDWTEIGDLRTDSESLRAQISRSEAEIRRIPNLEEEVLVLRERVKEYVTILPDDPEITGFVDKLTEFARASGVELTKLDDTAAKQRKVRKEKSREAFDRVSFKLSLMATGDEFLRFLDLFENQYERFVAVPSFKIEAWEARGKQAADTVAERAHKIDMELETYAYNPKSKGGDQVAIPKEAQKLEKLRQGGRLDSTPNDVKLVRYNYRPEPGRRDPFVDPRLNLAVNGKVSQDERRHQAKTLEEVKAKLQDIVDGLRREETLSDAVRKIQAQEANNAKIRELDAELTRLGEAKFFSVAEYEATFKSEVLAPFRALIEKRGALGPLSVGPAEVEDRVKALEAALSAADFKRVVALAQEVQQLKARIEPDIRLEPLFRRAEEASRQASTYLEFAGLEFRFGGCVCYAADPKQSVIIINDKSYSPGEAVAEGLVITGITPSEVIFEFRGVSVTRRHAADGVR